jgi:hypothetical protein
MTAVSISVNRGAIMDKMSDFTIGTSAPGVGDIEVRFQVLDTNSKNLTPKTSGSLWSRSAVFS